MLFFMQGRIWRPQSGSGAHVKILYECEELLREVARLLGAFVMRGAPPEMERTK